MTSSRSLRLCVLATALLGSLAFAQHAVDEVPAQPSPKKQRGVALELVVEVEVDTAAWAQRLTNADIDARESALDEVVAGARQDRNLRYALRTWAADLTQPELAWSARMALRDLSRKAKAVSMAWVPRMGHQGTGTIAILAPAQTPQQSAPEPDGNRLRTPPIQPAFPFDGPLKVSLFAPRAVEFPSSGNNVPPSIRHVNVEVHPEGVVMTVREIVRGRGSVRVYAAESLDQILSVHPALRTQIPGLASLAEKSAAGGEALRWNRPERGLQFTSEQGAGPLAHSEAPLQQHTLILGVQCVPLSKDEAERRLLGPGVGLLIERREPGSVAEAMGLMRGDILVELLGQPLCTPAEISRVLSENREKCITVKIVDMNGLERTRTWQPASTAPK